MKPMNIFSLRISTPALIVWRPRRIVRSSVNCSTSFSRLTKGWLRSPMLGNPEMENCGRPTANSLMFGRLMPYSEFVMPLVTTGSASIALVT